MTHEAVKPIAAEGANTLVVLVFAMLLTPAFFVSEHRWDVSLQSHFTVATSDAHLHVEGGSLTRRLAFPAIGLLGLSCLFRKKGHPLRFDGPLAVLLTFFFAWCAASLLWSTDPGLTFRRLVVLGCCTVGALGIARQLGPRGLCAVALAVTAAYAAVGIFAEISLGTFRPFSAGYRFSGTMHPNAQGTCCGTMAVAAACLASHNDRRRFFFSMLLAVAVLLVILTKSRTALGSMIAALFVLWALRGQLRGKVVAALGVAWIVCLVALTASLGGLDILDSAEEAALMGRHDSTGSLNGRTDLWAELMEYFWQRPVLGYGYEAFWDAGRIQDVSSHQTWTINSAHSAYLDTLLALGLVGAAALVATIVVGIVQGVRRYRALGSVEVAFATCLLLCGTLNGLLESPFFLPTTFVQFVLISGVMYLAFCPPEAVSREEPTPRQIVTETPQPCEVSP